MTRPALSGAFCRNAKHRLRILDRSGKPDIRLAQTGLKQRATHGKARPGNDELGSLPARFLSEPFETFGCTGIGERDGGKIENEGAWHLPDALECCDHAGGRTIEKSPPEAVDDHVVIDRFLAPVGLARIRRTIGDILGEHRPAALQFRRFSHPVKEEKGAQRHANSDAECQILEYGEQEGREQHQRIAA